MKTQAKAVVIQPQAKATWRGKVDPPLEFVEDMQQHLDVWNLYSMTIRE